MCKYIFRFITLQQKVKNIERLKLDRLIKNARPGFRWKPFFQVGHADRMQGDSKSRGRSRTFKYVELTRDESNTADGYVSSTG